MQPLFKSEHVLNCAFNEESIEISIKHQEFQQGIATIVHEYDDKTAITKY